MVILYTTGCPKCHILEKKLKEKGIRYETETDIDKMLALGLKTAPNLQVDGEIMDFANAVKWVNNQ